MAIFYRTQSTHQCRSNHNPITNYGVFSLQNKFKSEYAKLSDTNILKPTSDVLESRVQSILPFLFMEFLPQY